MRKRIRLTQLPLTVQLGRTQLRMQDLLNLQAGDIIPLREKKDEAAKVWVDGKVKFWGEPGASNLKKAVRIIRRVSDMEEYNLE